MSIDSDEEVFKAGNLFLEQKFLIWWMIDASDDRLLDLIENYGFTTIRNYLFCALEFRDKNSDHLEAVLKRLSELYPIEDFPEKWC